MGWMGRDGEGEGFPRLTQLLVEEGISAVTVTNTSWKHHFGKPRLNLNEKTSQIIAFAPLEKYNHCGAASLIFSWTCPNPEKQKENFWAKCKRRWIKDEDDEKSGNLKVLTSWGSSCLMAVAQPRMSVNHVVHGNPCASHLSRVLRSF